MALKTYKPVTPSQRQLVLVDRSALYKGKPVKVLTEGKSSSGGRNNNGRITVRFRGGGHKQAYRRVDFKRRKFDITGRIERIEYDPNRTAFIALVRYEDGESAYNLAAPRPAAAQPRCLHEPDRSSPWRRRGPHLGRSAPGHAVGVSDQGQEDPEEQVDHQVHHFEPPRAEEEEIEGEPWRVRFGKGPSWMGTCSRKRRRRAHPAATRSSKSGVGGRPFCRS